jgi:hypothetical protein
MDLKLTLFNAATLVIMGFTLVTAIPLALGRLNRNWPFLYFPLIFAYWRAFDGALNTWWIGAGLFFALLLRFDLIGARARTPLRWLSVAALVYVFLRGVDLLVGGELFYFFSVGRPDA